MEADFAFCEGAEAPAGEVAVAVLVAAEDLTDSCAGTAGEIWRDGVGVCAGGIDLLAVDVGITLVISWREVVRRRLVIGRLNERKIEDESLIFFPMEPDGLSMRRYSTSLYDRGEIDSRWSGVMWQVTRATCGCDGGDA